MADEFSKAQACKKAIALMESWKSLDDVCNGFDNLVQLRNDLADVADVGGRDIFETLTKGMAIYSSRHGNFTTDERREFQRITLGEVSNLLEYFHSQSGAAQKQAVISAMLGQNKKWWQFWK